MYLFKELCLFKKSSINFVIDYLYDMCIYVQVPEIDSYSEVGSKPDKVTGNIQFRNVKFTYPARKEVQVCIKTTYIIALFFQMLNSTSSCIHSCIGFSANKIQDLPCTNYNLDTAYIQELKLTIICQKRYAHVLQQKL